MPSRNIVKEFAADHFYHAYSRGVAKQVIFREQVDYIVFISLFKRYLSPERERGPNHNLLPSFHGRVDLLTFCLMPNHIHLLLYQYDKMAMPELMRSILTSYSMYFNKKYRRVGPIFQSRYKASLVSQQSYLEHISRYIHLNPRNWEKYEFSSLAYYLGEKHANWLKIEPILGMFNESAEDYLDFLRDYEQHKQMLEEVKWELANDIDED
jgi:putative transposase